MNNILRNLLIIMLCFITINISNAQYYSADQYYKEGKRMLDSGKYEEAIHLLIKAIESNPTAANYRAIAEAYEGYGNYPEAVKAYRKEAEIYRNNGDINAAIVEEQKANAIDVQFEVYFTQPAKSINSYLAKGEPERGCYIGAYIEDDKRIWGNFEKFNAYTGKEHSSFYAYIEYGEPFPVTWCKKIKSLGAIPHIALEPNKGLGKVKDDNYVNSFAEEAGKLDWPLFLRFASEMNGDWTAYHGNPSLYKEKFKLIHNIFEKKAPKVMMLWTPNSIPQSNIIDYYPGDEYVDWVGINIYSVHHHGSDISQSGEMEDPTYLLEYIYNLYSSRKPIQVSEFASTHYCKACSQDVTGFGLLKMGQIYGSLPFIFPRVKCINWFDCNTIEETGYHVTSPNDYSLTDNLEVLNYYNRLISSDYFIGKLNSDGSAVLPPYNFSKFKENTVIQGKSLITSFVRSYLKKPQINYYINENKVTVSREAPYYLKINYPSGDYTLKAELEGDDRGIIATKEIKFTITDGETIASYSPPAPIIKKVSLEPKKSTLLWKEKWGGWQEIDYPSTFPTPARKTISTPKPTPDIKKSTSIPETTPIPKVTSSSKPTPKIQPTQDKEPEPLIFTSPSENNTEENKNYKTSEDSSCGCIFAVIVLAIIIVFTVLKLRSQGKRSSLNSCYDENMDEW